MNRKLKKEHTKNLVQEMKKKVKIKKEEKKVLIYYILNMKPYVKKYIIVNMYVCRGIVGFK